MKEITICILGIILMALTLLTIELEEQTKLSKEQNEILTIYCKAMPECKKEMEK